MKTKIFGQKIINTYEVIDKRKEIEGEDGELKKVFIAKPYIKKNSEVADWTTIVPDIEGEIKRNEVLICGHLTVLNSINIGKDESIDINEKVYRADLDEVHVFTDKVIEKRDEGKEEAETRLAELIGDYNEQIIASDERMITYCKLHKLDIREADCEEVFKLVYPDQTFKIKDGVVYVNAETLIVHRADNPCIATYPSSYKPILFTCDTLSTYVTNATARTTSATTSTR